jgi:hypothetical protein
MDFTRQMVGKDRSGPLERLVNDELLDRDGLALFVAMKELALLRGQAAASQRFPEEIDDIALAAKLAVGDRGEARRFLKFHDLADGFVFDRFQRGVVDLALAPLATRFDQMRRPEKTADMVGAKRRGTCWRTHVV